MLDVKNYIPYDDIVDTSALSLKKLNDQLRYMRNKLQGGLSGLDLFPHSVTADQIDVTTLHVGTGGITLDESAFVAFGIAKASDIPTMPAPYTDAAAVAAWKASGYGTYIDINGIYSPTILASQITSLGTVTGISLKTASSGNRVEVISNMVAIYDTTSSLALQMIVDTGNVPKISFQNPSSTGYGEISHVNNMFNIGASSCILNLTGPSVNANGAAVLTTASTVTAKFG